MSEEREAEALRAALDAARGPAARADIRRQLIAALRALGLKTGTTDALHEALSLGHAALADTDRDAAPAEWSRTHALLGSVRAVLGEATGDPAWLAAAAGDYRSALTACAVGTLDWARTNRNLGAVLSLLGRHTEDAAALEEAVGCYRAALTAYTRETTPQDWAMTQSNLGDALCVLAEQHGEAASAATSAAACRAALEVFTKEAAPADWAMTTTNLANALAAQGGADNSREAVRLYRRALDALDDPRLAPAIRHNLRRAEQRLLSV